jgi:ribosomal protein S3AE
MAIRKKRWFEVEVPLINETVELIAFEPEEIDGRTISLDMTRVLRGKSIEAKFKVHVNSDKDITSKPHELTLLPYFVRRVMRRGTDYVEDSFIIECSDAKLRVKPLMITRKRVSRAVLSALRKRSQEEIIEWAKGKSYEELFDDVLRNKMQKPLSLKLKKIYPLSLCEIRMLEIVELKSSQEKKEKKKKSSKKEEVESGKTETEDFSKE